MHGAVGAVGAPGGQPRVAFVFTARDDRDMAIDFIADPERPRQLDPVICED